MDHPHDMRIMRRSHNNHIMIMKRSRDHHVDHALTAGSSHDYRISIMLLSHSQSSANQASIPRQSRADRTVIAVLPWLGWPRVPQLCSGPSRAEGTGRAKPVPARGAAPERGPSAPTAAAGTAPPGCGCVRPGHRENSVPRMAG